MFAGAKGLFEGVTDQLGSQVVGETPADDLSGVEVENHGEVKPTLGGWNEGTEWNEIACRRQPEGQRRSALANVSSPCLIGAHG